LIGGQPATNLWDKQQGIIFMAKTSPMAFYKQVKAEMRKVTWPSRKEMTVSVIAVFLMVVFASLFLFFADQVMAAAVHFILGLGSGGAS